MAAPSLPSDHPGLKVLADVAEVLAAAFPSDETLTAAVGVLRRGLGLRRCRLWVRSPDGARYVPITTPGDEVEPPGSVPPTTPWLHGGPHREATPGGSILYLPLIYEDETLGALEVIIPRGRYEHLAHEVVVVAANVLAPMIAGAELSQDLASEVALRTREVAETEKLAAVGQLAAGVVHEINNPLATILACTEALGLRTETFPAGEREAVEEYLKIIDTEVQRCRRIVESLLDFSRPKAGQMQRVDVNRVLEQTLFLLKHHARFKRLEVVRKLTAGLPPVLADPERLIQSFMALMLNAMDAMDSRGTLTVRSRINPTREDELLLEFIDTGTGIRQDDLSKIFEPFYTTKPQSRGTGLGLSICYGIVTEHRGRIEVESDVGVGSNFTVYLPLG
jgi:signal transduction histidine kinase